MVILIPRDQWPGAPPGHIVLCPICGRRWWSAIGHACTGPLTDGLHWPGPAWLRVLRERRMAP